MTSSVLQGSALGRLVAHVREVGDGVVSTLGPDGGPQAAYLPLAVTDAGELVFDARASSRKVANVARDPRVAVVVGGREGTTLQVQGVADVPAGPDRERCAAAYGREFPQFVASLTDPGIVVVRVRVLWARWGDFRVSPPVLEDLSDGGRG
ncbi:pyridoxamine 5'-phosphate oxidase family protein [Isoptericola sp. 4D.3]|jgi:general stress protein 26|uniref:Pyridoxamine 5'-phosphate oxidase family protein n=1 Tax=Isoptericola peretonis TaxID=2918523 RepID=A0ABT0J257_9MICO|nr:pyridoxamine 5'-phosphate oxidase family protein [Isoptericola sp. 4D.3]